MVSGVYFFISYVMFPFLKEVSLLSYPPVDLFISYVIIFNCTHEIVVIIR